MSTQQRGEDEVQRPNPLDSLKWADATDFLEIDEAAYLLREHADKLRERWVEQKRVLESGREVENPLPVLQFSPHGTIRFDLELLRVWARNEIELQRQRLKGGSPQSIFGGTRKGKR